ncbi:hypothetical protein [Aneurinibacillus aneurinilyticus]
MLLKQILKPGVTGFNSASRHDIGEFETLLYSTIVQIGGSVLSKDLELLGKNFYTYEIDIDGNRLYLLLNSTYPFVAFAHKVEYGGIDFCDNTELIIGDYYQMLTKDILNTTIIEEDLQNLFKDERKQIRYWNVSLIGDIVFNYFD